MLATTSDGMPLLSCFCIYSLHTKVHKTLGKHLENCWEQYHKSISNTTLHLPCFQLVGALTCSKVRDSLPLALRFLATSFEQQFSKLLVDIFDSKRYITCHFNLLRHFCLSKEYLQEVWEVRWINLEHLLERWIAISQQVRWESYSMIPPNYML
jgi:hypothetical protein